MPMEIPPPYEKESNCCEPREGHGGGCSEWLEGVKGGICCDLDILSDQALLNPCCNPEYASENTLCVEPVEWGSEVWGDDDDDNNDDDSFAGCDDSTCEDTVCQIEPSCCMSAVPYIGEEIKPIFPGGWNEQCASLANNFCSVCEDGTPLEQIKIDSDGDPFQLYAFMDLRDRESFVQVTNILPGPTVVHVQVFDVNNLCNENNFFDVYTGNDTHVYNMRDITTNDGNPAGFVLPEGAYGMVIVTEVTGIGGPTDPSRNAIVGNFRILDAAGYEYRTNMLGISSLEVSPLLEIQNYYFNYNNKGNVTLSDVVGMSIEQDPGSGEVIVGPAQTSAGFDIDIFNLDEQIFSCRDIVFSCTPDTFEYGINDAITHSRGKSPLCPSNVVPEGIVLLQPEGVDYDNFIGYVGLNNGNGRGSMDSFWWDNFFTLATQTQEIFPPVGP